MRPNLALERDRESRAIFETHPWGWHIIYFIVFRLSIPGPSVFRYTLSSIGDVVAKKRKIPDKLRIWIDIRKRFHLSHAHIQMARELGLNPRKFGKLANHKQEPWKLPLPVFIEKIYFKRFKKSKPDIVKSVERIVNDRNKKRQERKIHKIQLQRVEKPEYELGEIPF